MNRRSSIRALVHSTADALRQARMRPELNTLLRSTVGARPWRFRVPDPLWKRLPVVGEFHVEVPGTPGFRYIARGEPLGKTLFWRGIDGFEPGTAKVFRVLAEQSSTLLDVGAYSGYYAVLARTINPRIKAHCFEPVPGLQEWIQEHIAHNRMEDSIVVVPEVVSDTEGNVAFYAMTSPNMPSGSLLSEYGGEERYKLEARSCRLDEYARRLKRPADLIKIDAEGAELQVLRGATGLFETTRPYVVCEILEPDRTDEIEVLASRHDYGFGQIVREGVRPMDAIIPDPRRRDRNFLFWPKEKGVPDGLQAVR